MRVALILLSILHAVYSSCPDNFELVKDGQCRGLRAITTMKYEKAFATIVSMCKEIDGQPLIIHDEEENSYWASWKASHGDSSTDNWPIGLTCNTKTKLWEWADASVVDFIEPSASSELEADCRAGCFFFMTPAGKWIMDCTSGPSWKTHVFCTTQLPLQPPVTSGCDSFQEDSDDRICYEVGATAESWQEAQMSCRQLGADLASIHNSQENSFVRRLAVSNGAVDGIFLGGKEKGNAFSWIDGTAWDYANFHPGFPMNGLGDCLAMDTSSTSGLWMNRDCSSKLPVACIRNESSTASVPTCSSETWREGQVMTSPGFPNSASVPCDFILMAEQGKKIELEIIMLEANSCCDSLQIYDDYLGGKLIANLTGEVQKATFSTNSQFVKVVWNPNGGVNVRGMAMVFRGV